MSSTGADASPIPSDATEAFPTCWTCCFHGVSLDVRSEPTGQSSPTVRFAGTGPGLAMTLPGIDNAMLALARENNSVSQQRMRRAVRLALARWF